MFTAARGDAVIAYTHRQTRSGELTANERLTGPGITVLLRCFELIDSRTDRTPINLPSGQQLFIADLPEAAVRESVVNACIHRDYRANAAVQVEHSSTRLAVTSPGDSVPGVTAENLLTVSSRSRNASLAARCVGWDSRRMPGSGSTRCTPMARSGIVPPPSRQTGFYVTATLLGGAPNSAVTRFVNTLPSCGASMPTRSW